MYSQGQRKHAGRTDGRGGRAVWCMFTLPMFALRLRGPGPHLAKQVQSISSLEPGIENTASWGATLIISYSRSQISFKWKRKEHNILKNRSSALTHTPCCKQGNVWKLYSSDQPVACRTIKKCDLIFFFFLFECPAMKVSNLVCDPCCSVPVL